MGGSQSSTGGNDDGVRTVTIETEEGDVDVKVNKIV